MAIELRGLAWDHRRCWGPLDASIAPYRAQPPDVQIIWDRRSLYEFGEGRIEDVLRRYDLLIFDHPFVGDVAAEGLMVPFDAYLSDAERRRFEDDSVGASWRSYQALGRQWALPIDAAAQVAAYRPDLLADLCRAPSDETMTRSSTSRDACAATANGSACRSYRPTRCAS